MKTLFAIYDETYEDEISAIIETSMVVSRFTRVDNVIGARVAATEDADGFLQHRNNRLIIVIGEEVLIARLLDQLRSLRARKKRGLRAFVVNAEQVI